MQGVLKIVGWLVIVGGTLTSVGVFWIDHMNADLWMAMVISAAVSLAVGGVVLWVAGRWPTRDRSPAASGEPRPAGEHEAPPH